MMGMTTERVQQVLPEIVRRLCDALHPERIYLFGSCAEGTPGPDSDVVVSSRLRLARNLKGFPFLQKLSIGQQEQIVNLLEGEVATSILMNKASEGLSREEIVEQSKTEGLQREEATLRYESKYAVPVEPNSVHDYLHYIPVGHAVQKLTNWKNQDATICYLSSRKIRSEVEAIKSVLKKFNFPDFNNLYFRKQGENYKDVAEKIMPNILIEDDCESIGGEVEMTYPHIKPELKNKIKSVVIKEFSGIDSLPDNISELL
jgi:hypothetical protein